MPTTYTPHQPELPLQTLEGTLERITFQNEENGYTVARLQPRGKDSLVTIVGALAGVAAGESLRLRGVWSTHPEYGRQFEIRAYTVELPATIEGIRKYLGSGLIKGVGPVTANRIVDNFGIATLDIIESHPDRLREVPGIGEKRVERINLAWQAQKQIKEIMIFLQGHGVSTGLAVKIYKQYGESSLNVVQNDPYRLAQDIYGIGFKTADKIAQAMGIPAHDPRRIQAGLQYTLSEFSDDGHCFALQEALVHKTVDILGVPVCACQEQIGHLIEQELLVAEDQALYLPPFYQAESGVAYKLKVLMNARRDRLERFQHYNWEWALAWAIQQNNLQLAPAQKEAIRMALTHKVSILTGGPGTGKSTIIGSLIQLLRAEHKSVLLAAPTGRAAKRLSETTGLEAKTIHRLLEFNPGAGNTFLRDRQNPLDADMIIVDEASMIDILLMNHLLRAIEAGSHLLIVGDMDQLPSVGPGSVLHDLIHSQQIPVTRLTTIFRQSEDSAIILNAHRINQGQYPHFSRQISDFFLFQEQDAQRAADLILGLVSQRIPDKFGLDPHSDIQVLSPMHRGQTGVSELNQRLQERLNPAVGQTEMHHGQRVLRVNDRVMQIRNNYDKHVFNGDFGQIRAIDLEEQVVRIDFDGTLIEYDFSQMDEIVHAYAISIHKAQGSEFPAVIIPLLNQHYMMLQRNLLYTGVTRARKLVVLVGSPAAIRMALHNDRIAQRNTRLAQRLQTGPAPSSGAYQA